MVMLADVGNHKLKLVFAIREQSGRTNFVKKSFQSVILCPLFIITYCILIKLYICAGADPGPGKGRGTNRQVVGG